MSDYPDIILNWQFYYYYCSGGNAAPSSTATTTSPSVKPTANKTQGGLFNVALIYRRFAITSLSSPCGQDSRPPVSGDHHPAGAPPPAERSLTQLKDKSKKSRIFANRNRREKMCFLMSENKMHSSISNEKVITYMAKIKARECQNVEYKSSWHDEKGIDAQRIPDDQRNASTKDVLTSLGLLDDEGRLKNAAIFT